MVAIIINKKRKAYILANAMLLVLLLSLISSVLLANLSALISQSNYYENYMKDRLNVQYAVYDRISLMRYDTSLLPSGSVVVGDGSTVTVSVSDEQSGEATKSKKIVATGKIMQSTVYIYSTQTPNPANSIDAGWIIYKWIWSKK